MGDTERPDSRYPLAGDSNACAGPWEDFVGDAGRESVCAFVGDALLSLNLVGDVLLSHDFVGDVLLSSNFIGDAMRSPTMREAESSIEGSFLGVFPSPAEGATDDRLRPGTCAKKGSGVVSADLRRSWMACRAVVSRKICHQDRERHKVKQIKN